MIVVEALERLGGNLVERQRVVQVGLAHVEMRGQRGQLDVGQHAAPLRAVAAGPVELLHGDLQLAHASASWGCRNNCSPRFSRLCTVPLPWVAWSPTIRPRP